MDAMPLAAPPGAPPAPQQPPQQPVDAPVQGGAPPQQPAVTPAQGGVPPPPAPPTPLAPTAAAAAAQAAALWAGAAPANVTFKQVVALLVGCPSLVSRSTVTIIHALVVKLVAVLSGIPSHQSAAHGYTGLVEQREVYALTCEISWYDF